MSLSDFYNEHLFAVGTRVTRSEPYESFEEGDDYEEEEEDFYDAEEEEEEFEGEIDQLAEVVEQVAGQGEGLRGQARLKSPESKPQAPKIVESTALESDGPKSPKLIQDGHHLSTLERGLAKRVDRKISLVI